MFFSAVELRFHFELRFIFILSSLGKAVGQVLKSDSEE